MLGKHDDARALMNQSLALAPDDPYAHYYDALILLRAGSPDAAITALRVAIKSGYSKVMLAAEPHFAVLQDDPRFQALVN